MVEACTENTVISGDSETCISSRVVLSPVGKKVDLRQKRKSPFFSVKAGQWPGHKRQEHSESYRTLTVQYNLNLNPWTQMLFKNCSHDWQLNRNKIVTVDFNIEFFLPFTFSDYHFKIHHDRFDIMDNAAAPHTCNSQGTHSIFPLL